ncbi:cytochrome c/c1 heme-lyase [Lentinula aff. detonsa]|uniref:Holocytochrome c-type synthase n=1 Tax=Lentinula aff. detonsa TaxID=2804958 RepID=A0AA38NN19_9AGAR|nr:cytochrome c/c1 heme-lyase [Lentinula aff. detonsa]KAJ3795673.1 cytochrome c/c1 heme-lyase [Lentinula aff. detonsa]
MGQSVSSSTGGAQFPVDHASLKSASCPVDHDSLKSSSQSPAQCPVDHKALHSSSSSQAPAECPVDHSSLNQMPTLSQGRTPNQVLDLPTARTESSILRDSSTKWDYPSPQQFYNALVRKGWETPEEHIETMVEIHNFLNEQAWQEVLKWEKRVTDNPSEIQLARFKGRPGEISPKARFWLLAGWLLPSRFNTEPPFDRHDWIVRRPNTGEEVRYVIDYYSAPPEPNGSPVFSLDVRPALDSFASVKERIAFATEEAWAEFRENRSTGIPKRD